MTIDLTSTPPASKQHLSQLPKQRSERQWIEGLIVSAQERKWFGTITIEVKRGMVHLVKAEQTLKPPSPPQ